MTTEPDAAAVLNGLPGPGRPPTPGEEIAELSARVDGLTTRLQLVATAVAGILAERMQPEIQQAILAQLTGQTPPPP